MKLAGSAMHNGYRMVSIDKVKYLEHRLIYHAFVAPLEVPDVVDHINHNHLDNRPSNLRRCTHAQNAMNQPGRRTAGLLPKHVYWAKNEKKYKVQVRANGKVHFIGTFADLGLAERAAIEARKLLHGAFSNSAVSP